MSVKETVCFHLTTGVVLQDKPQTVADDFYHQWS
jgi:hypothetical protein